MKTILKLGICTLSLALLSGCAEEFLEEKVDQDRQQLATRTEQEEALDYDALSKLFEADVRFLDSMPAAYDLSLRATLPFTHARVLSLGRDYALASDVGKVLLIAEASLYEQLTEEIQRYAFDIHTAYGCETILETVSGGSHRDIKNLILSYSFSLDGAVFIGDIPHATFEIADDHNKYGYRSWPCDLYYTDLNGEWGDTDGNGKYDKHSGHILPEIFVGRIATGNMGRLTAETEGMKRYLDKNHEFWSGATTVNRRYGFSYVDQDWVSNSTFKTDMQYLYGATNYEAKGYGEAGFGKEEYLGILRNSKYEFIQLACHASYYHLAMSGGSIWADEIFNNGTEAIGFNLFCCSACNWASVSPTSSSGFLAGAHVYNPQRRTLAVVGSTKTGSMLKFREFYKPLGEGKPIGLALKTWRSSIVNEPEHRRISWYYGMTVIGDPMVDFLYRFNRKSQVTFNGFDTGNSASHRYVTASGIITANNYSIPAGKHVIFRAPTVLLNAGFACDPGSELLIENM